MAQPRPASLLPSCHRSCAPDPVPPSRLRARICPLARMADAVGLRRRHVRGVAAGYGCPATGHSLSRDKLRPPRPPVALAGPADVSGNPAPVDDAAASCTKHVVAFELPWPTQPHNKPGHGRSILRASPRRRPHAPIPDSERRTRARNGLSRPAWGPLLYTLYSPHNLQCGAMNVYLGALLACV